MVRTAILYANYTNLFSYFDDWLEALQKYPESESYVFDITKRNETESFRESIQDFDFIITLHSLLGDGLTWMEKIAPLLNDRKGTLLSFVGNEVNLPGSRLSEKRALLEKIAPDYIATQLLLEAGEYLFSDIAEKSVLAIPHALNPNAFSAETARKERPIDIGVRTARYLPHLGDNDRNRISDYFTENADSLGLLVDISDVRENRAGWARFLNSSKGTVSTEAGSWYIEKDDRTVEEIRQWMLEGSPSGRVISDNSLAIRLYSRLPEFAKYPLKLLKNMGAVQLELANAQQLAFDEVYDKFFKNYAKPKIHGKCISSRHFDAIGTKTVQIMFPGRYNDILQPDVHYLELDPDFANVDEVLRKYKDEEYSSKIANDAYELVREAHTYETRVNDLYNWVSLA